MGFNNLNPTWLCSSNGKIVNSKFISCRFESCRSHFFIIYYICSNIFYTLFKGQLISLDSDITNFEYSELYENYLNYKNKLNYSLIELNLNSDTLDEIISYLDNEIINYLSVKIK